MELALEAPFALVGFAAAKTDPLARTTLIKYSRYMRKIARGLFIGPQPRSKSVQNHIAISKRDS